MREGTIGIGVVSFAHGHVNAYCGQWMNTPDVKLVMAWDDDVARGRAQAKSFGIPFTEDLDALLSNPAIDLVAIASETSKHMAHAVAAAGAGKDILLQKPMALSLADCDRIIKAVDDAGVWFSMAYQMRHDPANQKIRELVADGSLGQVILLRRRHCIPVLFNKDFLNAWHVKPELNMGMFMDDASHAADFIYWVLGRPATCTAEIEPVITDPKITPDDTGVAIYKWSDRKMATLLNSSVTWIGENTTEVYGDKGVLIQNHDDAVSTGVLPPSATMLKLWLHEQAEKGWQDLGLPVPEGGHGTRIQAVAPGVLADYRAGTPRCPAREGRVSIEMVLAAYRSAAEGRRVGLDEL